jgi:hypothetical protein
MTKTDGHKIYDQNFGHYQSGLAMSDSTWTILRGRFVTKLNGRKSKSAQSSSEFFMGWAQQFTLFIFFPWSARWAKPKILAFLFLGLWPFGSTVLAFLTMGPLVRWGQWSGFRKWVQVVRFLFEIVGPTRLVTFSNLSYSSDFNFQFASKWIINIYIGPDRKHT